MFVSQDAVMQQPTTIQAARAANIVYAMLQFRRVMDREELQPVSAVQALKVFWNMEHEFNNLQSYRTFAQST